MSEDVILHLWGKVKGLVTNKPEDMDAKDLQEVKTLLEERRKLWIEENREFRQKVKEHYEKNLQEYARQGRTDEMARKPFS